jgi:hypothetical protein
MQRPIIGEEVSPDYIAPTPGFAYFSNPTNTVASSTDFRFDATALAGKVSCGQPSAMFLMMT